MTELKGLIFDVDGTMADTEQDGHRIAFNQAFADAGLDWHWDEDTYERLLSVFGGKERIRYFLDHYLQEFISPTDIEAFIRKLHARKTVFYVDLMKSGAIPLRPGVGRLIREARQAGLKLAIASTTTAENVTALLTRTLGEQSIGWFEVIACGDIVKHKKPAPDIYEYTLRKLALPASECLVFEDSESGLTAARAAGLKTLITVNASTRNHDFTGAAIVLDHLGEADMPFNVLAGNTGSAKLVDVPFLKSRVWGK